MIMLLDNEDILQHYWVILEAQVQAAQDAQAAGSSSGCHGRCSPALSTNDQESLSCITRHPPISNNFKMSVRCTLTKLNCTVHDPCMVTSELKEIFQGCMNWIRTDKTAAVHELLYHFMEKYCYVVPRDDLDDLKESVHTIRGCEHLFMNGWLFPS